MKHFLVIFLLATSAYAQPSLNVIWDRSGAGDSSRYGYTILPLGDQNNDGYADWAVFALGGIGDAPMIEFFHGGHPMPIEPYMSIQGDQQDRTLSFVNVVGDLNGDRIADWMLGWWFSSQPRRYTLDIHFGEGALPDTTPDISFAMSVESLARGIGDFNGDGFGDFYIFNASTRLPQVYYGGSQMDTIADWPSGIHPNGSEAYTWMFGNLNGDAYGDYVSYQNSTNTTYIFLGGANPDTVPAYTWPDMAHWPLAIARDLNGDHYDDLIFYNREVHYGGPVMHSTPDVVLNFPCEEGVPLFATGVGDINGDGYGDLVLIRDYCSDNYWGVLSLYLGQPSLNPQPAVTIEGRGWQNLISIQSAAGLGDVNGDEIDDWAIGAWDDIDYEGWRGRVLIISGDTTLRVDAADPFILPPSSFSLSCYPNPFNATTTISFTLPKTGSVDLKVYDVTGRKTGGLLSAPTGVVSAGEHSMVFDGSDLPSGIYFVRIQSGTVSKTQKMVLLK
jgi:hypothetical protein